VVSGNYMGISESNAQDTWLCEVMISLILHIWLISGRLWFYFRTGRRPASNPVSIMPTPW
jgi:hypothetical protein